MVKEIKLPSGAFLRFEDPPFADAVKLYQAMLLEFKSVHVSSNMELQELFKNLFCIGFSSPAIQSALDVCMKRCAYKPAKGNVDFLRLDADTFEPVERREDYLKVCADIAREVIAPFGKSLYAEFQHVMQTMQSTPK